MFFLNWFTHHNHGGANSLKDFSEELNFFSISFINLKLSQNWKANHAIPQVSKILLVILKGNKALALPQATCPCTPSMSKRMTYDFVSRKWQFFFKNLSSFIELQKILTMISCHRQYSLHRKFLRSMLRNMWWYAMASKVEKILKCSLDLIPSPSQSVKIQIMGKKVCLSCKGKTLLGIVNKLLKTKSLLTSPNNVLPYYLK